MAGSIQFSGYAGGQPPFSPVEFMLPRLRSRKTIDALIAALIAAAVLAVLRGHQPRLRDGL